MRGYLIIVVLLVASVIVLFLGMVIPRFIIGNGVDQCEGSKRELAEQALVYPDAFFAGEPTSQLAIAAKRVARIGTCRRYPPNVSDKLFDAFQGEVKLYTIFGIPYGELRFQCEGSEIIRCPQNTAECTPAQSATVSALRPTIVVAQKDPFVGL